MEEEGDDAADDEEAQKTGRKTRFGFGKDVGTGKTAEVETGLVSLELR